jgi:hypothetical protein
MNSSLEKDVLEYQAWRDRLVGAIESFRTRLDTSQQVNVEQSLRMYDLIESLRTDRMMLAFIAEYSRGKTELINALFFSHYKRRLLPSDIGRTTMCPTEIFHDPGPLLLAMMEDMRTKPPVGVAVELPTAVRNAQAVIADSAAIVKWDPPTNLRTAQVTAYIVRNVRSGAEKSSTTSPVVMGGLKNGTTHTFTITASNSLGLSPIVTTDPVTPQPAWKSTTIIDPNIEPTQIATTTFNKRPVIV